ncbi:FAD-dependent oxidoreductase [Paraburkholderia sp. GAS334]|uniref:FAD-dependent oxidoreductase n=1 Tax=Paraburkholderia sp. GAS334 TaxID=3035131 RepID=UPI003D259955
MAPSHTGQEAVVIGGGFYGTTIAAYLVRARGMKRVTLIEREDALLKRASCNNQARIHNGYHYPRSFTTAYRSRVNLRKFVLDWPDAVKRDFTKLYAIARQHSKVTAKQFERFCHEIDANIRPAPPALRSLFESRLIEDVFLVEEYAFDSGRLAAWAANELGACGVQVTTGTRVTDVARGSGSALTVAVQHGNGSRESIACHYVFNCTYSGLNQILGDYPGTQTHLKQEIAEIALIAVPPRFQDIGVTVMDGPFFSTMPFPARGLHSLSHVRYTPHLNWSDESGVDPYERLSVYPRESRVDRMLRDVVRYIPSLSQARHVESLFEVKTVLAKNEIDDGRPILFEKHPQLPGCFSVLGGKIDNIYDVLEKLDAERLETEADRCQTDAGVIYG